MITDAVGCRRQFVLEFRAGTDIDLAFQALDQNPLDFHGYQVLVLDNENMQFRSAHCCFLEMDGHMERFRQRGHLKET